MIELPGSFSGIEISPIPHRGLLDEVKKRVPAKRLGEAWEIAEAVLFLATLGGDPAGFAQLYPIHSSVSLKRVFVLNDLYVAEAGRRRGVATALLQALEAHAWAMGASSLRLNVARGNTGAQALYEAASWARDEHFFMYQRFPAG